MRSNIRRVLHWAFGNSTVTDNSPEVAMDDGKNNIIAEYTGRDLTADSTEGAAVEVTHNGRLVTVSAGGPIWSYAAHLVIDPALLSSETRVLLRCDLWVTAGTVGIGLVGGDDQFIEQQSFSPSGGWVVANFKIDSASPPKRLTIRNAGNFPARVVVDRIALYELECDPAADARDVRQPDNVSPASQPIENALRLHAAVSAVQTERPLVSLILTVKNGLPYLKEALASVRSQTYPNIELVIQDANSTDGSSELLSEFDGIPISYRREADGGIGDANGRAMTRCRGQIVGTIDSDNLLEPTAIETVVNYFAGHPETAVAYGAVRLISSTGEHLSLFRPAHFEFLDFISCKLVPPWSTAFFNLAIVGEDLFLDPGLKTCADYDVWLRLSHLPIVSLPDTLGATRLSDSSMTCRPESYEQFCADKVFALKRYAEKCTHEPLRHALVRHGMHGIYCWAAESLLGLAPEEKALISLFVQRAAIINPNSAQVAKLIESINA